MVDVLTPAQRQLNMSRIRGKDTKPDLLLRRGLHALGFRFRLHRKDLPERPDPVFPSRRAVIFVHGCFWHGHGCALCKMPATRPEFWRQKLADNRARDDRAGIALVAAGWRVLVVWECALRGPVRLPAGDTVARCGTFLQSAYLATTEITGKTTDTQTPIVRCQGLAALISIPYNRNRCNLLVDGNNLEAQSIMASSEEGGAAVMRPRARLIGLIGEELVTDEAVAIVELVKNAYDADATTITVRFSSTEPPSPNELTVEDNGHGMSLDIVLNAWFQPGTVSKRVKERSPKGRLFQGAKGIGRFASARLGKTILLETKTAGAANGVSAVMDWRVFTEDRFLDEIEVLYEPWRNPDIEHGTRLMITELDETVWSDANYVRVHERLSRLISPFDDVQGFQILLEVPWKPDISGLVEPPAIIQQPRYRLTGTVDASGHFRGTLQIEGSPPTDVNTPLGRPDETVTCGSFEIEIRAWDRDSAALKTLGERENLGLREVRRLLDSFSGVSVYRDGFRVYPYGERGNDWLGLDLRSRLNPGRNLANNQIVAAIRISRLTNAELRDKSNREGMVDNEQYSALREWFTRALTLVEAERFKARPRDTRPLSGSSLFEAFAFEDVSREISQRIGAQHPVAKLVASAEKRIAEGVERVQETLSRLLLQAGVGQMVDVVVHEIGAPVGKIARELSILESELEGKLPAPIATIIAQSVKRMRSWLEQVQNLRERLQPFSAGRRGHASGFPVREEIELTLDLINAAITRFRISVALKLPPDPLKVFMSRAALAHVLVNLLDNAVFWVAQKHGKTGNGRIEVELERLEHGFRVVISDNGPGIDGDDIKHIFEPYWSRKPEGSGLGLHIARMVIEPYGNLSFRTEGPLEGACFEATFEKGVGL
jgi:DNA mismatch endonuclease Vsr